MTQSNNLDKLLKRVKTNFNKFIQLRDLYVSNGELIAKCSACGRIWIINNS